MGLFDTNFTSIDWVIVAVYLGGSILIGLWANRFVGGLSDYLVAGRTLRIRLALATMTGTELGLVTVMYVAQLGYTKQFASLYLAVIEVLGLAVIGATGLVVYRLRQEAVLTVPEYYQRRYSQTVRVVGAVMMVLAGVLNMGVFLKAGSLFLVGVTGLDDPMALKLIMTGLLLLVLFYTVLGGMVSVVITDLIQFLVLGVGALVVSYFVLDELGGIGGLWDLSGTTYVNPLLGDNPVTSQEADGVGPWMLMAQWLTLSIAVMLWPATVSRTLAVKTPAVARKLYLFSSIPFLARRTLPALWGIGAFAYFAVHADLGSEFQQAIDSKNISTLSAMPLYLAKIIPSGLLGIVTAAMLAAFMSTHDSYLLCWSSVLVQDVVAPIRGEMSTRSRIQLTRLFIVLIGIFVWAWGLFYEGDDRIWDYLAVTGAIYFTGAAVVLAGGLYWKRASSAGAIAGLLCGATAVLGIEAIRDQINQALGTGFTGPEFGLFSIAFSLTSFVLFSLLLPDQPTSTNGTFPSEEVAS